MRLLSVAVYMLATSQLAMAQEFVDRQHFSETSEYHMSMAFGADGTTLYAAGTGNLIKARNIETGEVVAEFTDPDKHTFGLAVSPDGKWLAAGDGASIRVRHLPSGELFSVLEGHRKSIWSLAFTPDSKVLVSSSYDKSIKLWRVATQELIATIPSEGTLAAISPDGNLLASVGPENTIELRTLSDRQIVRTLTGHTAIIQALAFSPDSATLASGARWGDTDVRLWDVSTGENVSTLRGRDDPVESVAFSPDGELVASSKLNGMVELWDVASGQQLDRMQSGIDGKVAFSPNGDRLVQVYGIQDAGSGVYVFRLGERAAVVQ